VKSLKSLILGTALLSTGQAFAEENTASEIQLLKAKLKQLEQRIESQGQKEYETRAKLASIKNLPAYKVAPVDACGVGKFCYKGVTFTPGGWIDLAGIYRTRNLASDTGSVYSFIPFPQSKAYNAPEARFSARQTRFSLLGEGDVGADTL
jgi:hypothetical protein